MRLKKYLLAVGMVSILILGACGTGEDVTDPGQPLEEPSQEPLD